MCACMNEKKHSWNIEQHIAFTVKFFYLDILPQKKKEVQKKKKKKKKKWKKNFSENELFKNRRKKCFSFIFIYHKDHGWLSTFQKLVDQVFPWSSYPSFIQCTSIKCTSLPVGSDICKNSSIKMKAIFKATRSAESVMNMRMNVA